MKNRIRVFKQLLVPLVMGVVTLAVTGCAGGSIDQTADPSMKVEITMTDQEYTVHGSTLSGALTAMVVHNKGSITHGITSPLFKEGILKKEGDGVEIRNPNDDGFRAYHLEPGQTMTLYFRMGSRTDPRTGRIRERTPVPFWCDIHTHLKGEFLVLSLGGINDDYRNR
jgi:hypothetical protein